MPKKYGGKKKHTFAKVTNNRNQIWKKEEYQDYALVTKLLGDGRLMAMCHDGKERMCKIRGKMRRRVIIKVTDYILISFREYNCSEVDVIHRYSKEDVDYLVSIKEIDLKNFRTEEEKETSNDTFEFTNDESIDFTGKDIDNSFVNEDNDGVHDGSCDGELKKDDFMVDI